MFFFQEETLRERGKQHLGTLLVRLLCKRKIGPIGFHPRILVVSVLNRNPICSCLPFLTRLSEYFNELLFSSRVTFK